MIGACIVSGRFNAPCDKCHTMGEDFRRRQGCDGPSVFPVAMTPDGTPLYECPGRLIEPMTSVACGLFPLWESGRPINAPCVMDEPAALVDAMRIIGAEMGARQQEEIQRGR